MAKRSLSTFANPVTLEDFDDGSLHAILAPYAAFCAEHGCTLPATPGQPIDREALAAVIRLGETVPRPILDAVLTIGDVGLPAKMKDLIVVATRLGMPMAHIIGDDIPPLMAAARIWCWDLTGGTGSAALRRLAEQTQIEIGHTYRTYRPDADEAPALVELTEQRLQDWEQHLTVAFAAKGLGEGVRIFPSMVDDFAFFLVRHGCTPKREIIHLPGADTRNQILRPSRTDILRYDTLTGDLALYQREARKWQTELYLTSVSLYAFDQPHLFSAQDAFTLDPLKTIGPGILAHDGITGIERIKLVRVATSEDDGFRYCLTHEATDVFAAWAQKGFDWHTLPPCIEAVFEVSFTGAKKPRKVKVSPPNVVRCARHGDEVMVQEWLLRHGIKQVLVTADAQPDF